MDLKDMKGIGLRFMEICFVVMSAGVGIMMDGHPSMKKNCSSI